ncbi:sensor histidine kinase [Ancylobacter lacus]|uniref:sensor histidine kinase n=1 Tax=Ancylobacter lacus TaxID=2579970 RepID=UPI001BCE62F2|nr:HWE histidine kinase domain-containing protein [Ancylobacter lacus]MBS7541041.1 PAS domain-containing protein [Ancylobacter lacus]
MEGMLTDLDAVTRVVTAASSLAIAAGVFRLLQIRRDLPRGVRWLVFLLGTLIMAVGVLSILISFDNGALITLFQSTARVVVSLTAVAGAIALWSNYRSLLNLPSPGTFASEQRRLTLELATALQRYEMALRGSNVAIFTQDGDLRYTSISKPLFGLPIERVLGSTDLDLLDEKHARPIANLKREAFAANETRKGEVEVDEEGAKRWYDLHIEPLRDLNGATIGLTGAAVDVTDRKENEQHLRMLMRELTHRSKNLLAVIQAMARQTARHAGTIDDFVEQFSARLQALARSHDLLVQESWHGASLGDMVRSQLGHHLNREGSQVTIEGPDILLKPEAAQNLGLALHELSTNAAKYGALSVPGGHVLIHWARRSLEEGGGIDLNWTEKGGPKVTTPAGRGFGSLVIERNLSRALDGEVVLAFEPEGVMCHVVVPEQHVTIVR